MIYHHDAFAYMSLLHESEILTLFLLFKSYSTKHWQIVLLLELKFLKFSIFKVQITVSNKIVHEGKLCVF